MSPEEKDVLQNRIAAFEKANVRIKNLLDGISKLTCKECDTIQIDFDRGTICYKAKGNERLTPVCWASSEAELLEEIRAAIITNLQRRLEAAEQDKINS